MKAKSDIVNLGERHQIETPHTRHVTGLALDLFDGFAREMKLGSADRNLLFAAGRLHDIAYAADPPNHVVEAARILRDHPVEAYSPDEWLMVIGIVLLHKRDWRSMLTHETFPRVGAKELMRIKKLAAMLRVADGLDHGHIQDAEITCCTRGRKVDKIGVHGTWYDNNIPWAEGKADLWESVFKRPFRIEGSIDQPKHLFAGIVHKKDSAVGAARRILYSQTCVMRDNVPGMMKGSDPECLHDYHVAMRRFRAALHLFKPLLADTHAVDIDQRMDGFSERLGPIRDTHAALQLVHSLDAPYMPDPELVLVLQSEVDDANAHLRALLESDDYRETIQCVSRFLRVELPQLAREGETRSFVSFAAGKLEPLLGKILKLEVSGLHKSEPAYLHQVLKLCRRGRYFAEFCVPAMAKKAKPAAKQLGTVAAALGDIRDGRLLARRYDDPQLAAAVGAREAHAWERFRKRWDKLTGP